MLGRFTTLGLPGPGIAASTADFALDCRDSVHAVMVASGKSRF
jgi:hypothetical protein